MVQPALNILCRQCSELAWANIINSTSLGLRPSDRKLSARFWVKLADANQMVFTKVQSPAQRRAEDYIAQRYHLRLARSPWGHDYGECVMYISARRKLTPSLVATFSSWPKIVFADYPITILPSAAKSYKTLVGLKKFLGPTVTALTELVRPADVSADLLRDARKASLERIKNVAVHTPDGRTHDLLYFLKEHFDNLPTWVTEASV